MKTLKALLILFVVALSATSCGPKTASAEEKEITFSIKVDFPADIEVSKVREETGGFTVTMASFDTTGDGTTDFIGRFDSGEIPLIKKLKRPVIVKFKKGKIDCQDLYEGKSVWVCTGYTPACISVKKLQ